MNESLVWEHLNRIHFNQTDVNWLEQVYSPEFSIELRMAIAERLGLLSDKGWPSIQNLFQRFGIQPELIHATGICRQIEAKDWLLKQLEEQETTDEKL